MNTPQPSFSTYQSALAALDCYVGQARDGVAQRIASAGKQAPEQTAVHGLAWLATMAAALRALQEWAAQRASGDAAQRADALMLRLAFAEYLGQACSLIPIGPGESVSPADLSAQAGAEALRRDPHVAQLLGESLAPIRLELAKLIEERGLEVQDGDATLAQFRGETRRFVLKEVLPHAHRWHRDNQLIPREVLQKMGELGVFGLTIPENYGGLGLGKQVMCVVTEELSRGYIGVGSIGTRSEIAAELILNGGTQEQRDHWLPKIAAGTVTSTAAFTEPDAGSDLASVKTRAQKGADGNWRVNGAKTWMTHGARADLMVMLVRTAADIKGYRGLSILLAPKTEGDDARPFRDAGISGSEIPVLGYRGMKEFAVAFDGFMVEGRHLLGEAEGNGFKQLMSTFESARIQTAARAIGVARNALDVALEYASVRTQFGSALKDFPRVAGKIAWMATEIELARQLTYAAARRKDGRIRCDMEAGMAKLLGARTAWMAADAALQIHGGNGYALEFPVSRLLCDARVLSIFEGAAEIQAEVIARGLLGR